MTLFCKELTREHSPEEVVSLFNQCFIASENTQLVCCEEEPVYRPADSTYPHHRIIFAHGFFASALHEISHWCVAGKARRLLEDFGYWYEPDGRSDAQQAEFERVEVKPQALEWIFSRSANAPFHFSADNLNGDAGPSEAFKIAVLQQVRFYLEKGLPDRAKRWSETLIMAYRAERALKLTEFKLDK